MRIGRIFEGDHSMAPSPTERLNAIEPRLEAVESALGIRPASTGLKRFKELVAKYPLWVTIFVAVASIMATVACTYFPRWTDQGKKDRSEAINRQIEDFLNSAQFAANHYYRYERHAEDLAALYSGSRSTSI
jgi:hypothetical protein